MVDGLDLGRSRQIPIAGGKDNVGTRDDSTKMLNIPDIVRSLGDNVEIVGNRPEKSTQKRIKIVPNKRDFIQTLALRHIRESAGNGKDCKNMIGEKIYDAERGLERLTRDQIRRRSRVCKCGNNICLRHNVRKLSKLNGDVAKISRYNEELADRAGLNSQTRRNVGRNNVSAWDAKRRVGYDDRTCLISEDLNTIGLCGVE